MRQWASRLLSLFHTDRQLARQLEDILGFSPKYLPYYQLALTHRSNHLEINANNERLEFLGDAVLGIMVGEYLFKKYPHKDEGFLTEMRSRMVRRETLNDVANRMGIPKLVSYNKQDKTLSRSHIFGNALEALIGAVYLDQGFTRTRQFILRQVIKPFMDVDYMANTDNNYKNQLLSWAQKGGHSVRFDVLEEIHEGHRKAFKVGIWQGEELLAHGTSYNKKDAGQVAAKHALMVLRNRTNE